MITDQSNSSTHLSLINRAQRIDDQAAWAEFVQRYGALVINWCRRWCKQDADAHDLTQDILLRVWRKLPDFHYDAAQSFRGWLWTLSRRAFVDSFRHRNVVAVHDGVLADELDKQALDFAKSMERQFDEELLQLAFSHVQQVVEESQWKMFEQADLKRMDAEEVARQFGKSLASLRMNNMRVRNKIKEQMIQIEESLNLARS